MVVDSLGLLLAVLVTAASADDGATAPQVLGRLDRHRGSPGWRWSGATGSTATDDLDAWLERSRGPVPGRGGGASRRARRGS